MKNQTNRIKSELYFHTLPERLNCAQAILKGFQKEFNISDQEIEESRALGGGRAQDGICGALFSAEHLLSQSGKPGITDDFKSKVGDIHCIEIKRNKFSCFDCLQIADDLLEKRLQ